MVLIRCRQQEPAARLGPPQPLGVLCLLPLVLPLPGGAEASRGSRRNRSSPEPLGIPWRGTPCSFAQGRHAQHPIATAQHLIAPASALHGHSTAPSGPPSAPHSHCTAPHGHSTAPRSHPTAPRSPSSAPHGHRTAPHSPPHPALHGHHCTAPHGHSTAPRSPSSAPHGHCTAPHSLPPQHPMAPTQPGHWWPLVSEPVSLWDSRSLGMAVAVGGCSGLHTARCGGEPGTRAALKHRHDPKPLMRRAPRGKGRWLEEPSKVCTFKGRSFLAR